MSGMKDVEMLTETHDIVIVGIPKNRVEIIIEPWSLSKGIEPHATALIVASSNLLEAGKRGMFGIDRRDGKLVVVQAVRIA